MHFWSTCEVWIFWKNTRTHSDCLRLHGPQVTPPGCLRSGELQSHIWLWFILDSYVKCLLKFYLALYPNSYFLSMCCFSQYLSCCTWLISNIFCPVQCVINITHFALFGHIVFWLSTYVFLCFWLAILCFIYFMPNFACSSHFGWIYYPIYLH